MNEDYLDAFVEECEEMIVDLNNALLTLERDPDDDEAIDHIFRCAHTLKGNFGAMGFEEPSKLAHAIEDLLDEIRQGDIAVSPEVMDVVFAGVDGVEAILGAIQAGDVEAVDPTQTIRDIEAVMAEADEGDAPATDADDEASGETAGGASAPEADAPAEDDVSVDGPVGRALEAVDADDLAGRGDRVFHVSVEVNAGEMKGVDGILAIESIDGPLDVLATAPGREDIEDGQYDDGFGVFVPAEDEAYVEDALDGIGKVEVVSVSDVTASLPSATAMDDGGDASVASESTSDQSVDRGGSEIKSIRVGVDQIDELYGLIEQLVTERIKLRRTVERADFDAALENLDDLDKTTTGLQSIVMDVRLIPLKKVVGTFPRMVRDIARDQGKQIDFQMEGTDVEVDRRVLDEIDDPLVHILRNAVDHGIEPPEEREQAGKDPEGTIRLRARRDRDHVTITVEDDGGGLDVDAVREKAVEQGIHTEAELEAMEDADVYDLIFHPGFSTADEVTDVSGRGVGMDVVHSTIAELDGSVDVDSEPGAGTTVTLRLPVNVAIVTVLFVEVGGRTFGLPIKNIDEITPAGETSTVNGQEVVSHGEDVYPVIRLDEVLSDADAAAIADGGAEAGDEGGEDDDGMLIRIRRSLRKAALYCDAVEHQDEVVIKPFEGVLSEVEGLGGTAVVGDGDVVPVIDVNTL